MASVNVNENLIVICAGPLSVLSNVKMSLSVDILTAWPLTVASSICKSLACKRIGSAARCWPRIVAVPRIKRLLFA